MSAPESRQAHDLRRSSELDKQKKRALCSLYRSLGGLGGIHPPEEWRKDEVITAIVDVEWRRLPEDRKLPDPPRLTPPCGTCGQGQDARAHHSGGTHNYSYTFDPDVEWVPESEAEAERLELLAKG